MRLLLLEDDDILGEALRDYLVAERHTVVWQRTLAGARACEDDAFDALLVDWQLPDGSGLDWLRARRGRGVTTPAWILTARDRLAERVQGLDSGADDYLVKPFAPEELAARLRALARRVAGAARTQLQLPGDVTIDLAGQTARRHGEAVELTAREWALLEALALRRGRLVAKSDLEQLALGPGGPGLSNALEVHMAALRRKLGRDLVETVRGMGYRLRD